ncbi:MAG TPA: dihydroorotase [Chloroflexota bacterium]|nr:dihydroorotase [Chloroflexota bacterium]
MIHDLLIDNAHIVTPTGMVRGALLVHDGRVVSVLAGGPVPEAREVVDAQGRHLLPGVVDIHVHFREPGQEYKATYTSESAAAAVGGVTSICDMPNNGAQAVVSAARLVAKAAVAARSSRVDFGLYAYLVGDTIEQLRDLRDAGAIGFKWDMSLAGTEVAPGVWLPTAAIALPAFKAAAALGMTIGIHAEDRPTISRQASALKAAGRSDAAAHLASRPAAVEVTALREAIALARASGVHLHVHHLSSAAGLDLIRAAKREGLWVTSETIPPFLFLDSGDYERLGTVMKIHPAVKEPEDRAALWEGLRDGSIECIATDHAPHTAAEKRRGVWEASPGAIGVQTSLMLMLTEVNRGRLSLERCVALMAANPAGIHGLSPRKGAIVAGADADLVLVNLAESAVIRNQDMLTPNQLTPFDGAPVRGVPKRTWLRGRLIARDGLPVGEAAGRQLWRDSGAITRPLPPGNG